ncbi:MAG: hypothetical protein IPQ07_36175 [Myxococcales bacterium]|nr:hypothetical protein [Myxococcales bacterium]
MVLDKINGVYMSGLQRCYKKGLLEDAKLGGKISMSFTVNERGGLDDNSARSEHRRRCLYLEPDEWLALRDPARQGRRRHRAGVQARAGASSRASGTIEGMYLRAVAVACGLCSR